jgi:hypothetical protein
MMPIILVAPYAKALCANRRSTWVPPASQPIAGGT